MLRIKAMRELRLNCSSGGVLYHYTHSMDSLESIVENGLQTSIYPNSNHEEPLIGISFSRTKTTIPYLGNDTQTIGYDVDKHGDSYKRWVYGLIFSKSLLSNLGKIRPYNWATDAGARIDYRIKKIDTDKEQLPTDWVPDTIKLGIVSQWSTDNPLTTTAKVYIDYPEDTVDWDDTYYTDQDELFLENKSYLPQSTNVDSRAEYDQLIEPLTKLGLSQSTPVDGEYRVVTLFTGVVDVSKLNSYPKTIRSIVTDALSEIKPKLQRRQYHQRKERTPDAIKVQVTGCEPFYLKDQGDTRYETLTKDLQELAKISPDLHLDGNSEAGWLTKILNAMLEQVKEDKANAQGRSSRLSVKGQNPEPTYFPDSGPTAYEEFKKAAKELKEKFPSIDVNQNLDTSTWTIRGELPEGTHFTDLPKTIQVLVSRSGIYESEDRLLLPSATPGTAIPETKDAIIGIVVPRKEYHSKAVERLHKEFSDIPVYTYAGKNEKKRRSNAKPIPKEAYQNPVD